jgi:hypothetical protein
MKDTFYDKMPTVDQFNSYLDYCKKEEEEANKNTEQRMENYFNCLDDYSWGGLCDQASSQIISLRRYLANNLATQLEEGAFKETFKLSILQDLEGNTVSTKIVKGKFGPCWIIKVSEYNANFVSVAKKADTYAKKGYKVVTREVSVEYYYTAGLSRNGKIIPISRILSDTILDYIADVQKTDIPKEIFFAQ